MEAAIIPFESQSAVRKAEFTDAIQLWRQTRDIAETLSREEIASLRGFDRIDALRKSIIENLARYYRTHERADVAPGVLVLQTLLCDNDRGASTVSQPTLAKFFRRSISSIADAQKRLRDDGLIVTSRGRYSETYPVVPRAMTMQSNHLTWLVGSVCDDAKPINLLAGPIDCQSTGPVRGLPKPDGQSLGGTVGLKPVNQPVEAVSIIRPDPMQLHLLNSKEERGPREGSIARVATAVAATFVAAVPLAAAAHPVEQFQTVAAECWQTQKAQMGAAMNMAEARAQRQVWLTPSGGLEIAGDFRDEMQRTFPLVDMVSALAAACPNVRSDSGALAAFQTIRRQYGFMQQDALRRQARAEAYAKPNHGKSTPFREVDIPLTMPMPRDEVL